MTGTPVTSVDATAAAAPLLAAARGERPAHHPVWFMRQAGRSLPEYRKLREGVGMLDAGFAPEMTSEITPHPVLRHGVDAAILFSDIVVPLRAAGVDVDIVPGTGPVLAEPVRDARAVGALPELDPEQVQPVLDAIGLVRAELGATPLIGFAGAPFTLASYLVAGG